MAELKKSKKGTIQSYKDEFSNWLDALGPYQENFKTNYTRYNGEKEMKGTQAKISDPVAFELTERIIQKMFEREPKFYAESRGKNIPREVKQVITSTAEWLWSNSDMVTSTGPMRSKLKVGAREFIITGNMVVESYWNHQSDAPDMRVIPIENVVFDPSKTLKTSPVYYTRQFVSIDYLEDNVEISKDGEVITGMFNSAAIKKLKRLVDGRVGKQDNRTENLINRSDIAMTHKEDEFQLISRYEGDKVCRFVWDDDMEDPISVQEFVSIIGTDPLDQAMDIEVPQEPYAMSVLSRLAGLFRAKDLILSQTIDYGAKVLNPPTIVNPNAGINLKTIANMYKLGGIVLADPSQIKQGEISSAPQRSGIDMMNWIEGRGESVSGANGYMAGTPNSQTDKTQGTKGGIEALQAAGSSPITDRQKNIEESIIEPMINKWLKMVGATMSEDEFKWVLVTGEEAKWVKVTKGLLTGKIKLVDLMQADVVEEQEIGALVELMMSEGKDPENDVIFDIDWLVRVETGSLAERDTQKEIENKKAMVELGMSLMLPLDTEKLWKDIAQDSGISEPGEYLKKEPMQPQGQEMMAGGVSPNPQQGMPPVGGMNGQPSMPAMPQGIPGQSMAGR